MAIRLRSREGRGLLLAAVTGSGLAFLDTTVVNVALPAIARGLQTKLAGLQWTIDAYLLTLTALLLLGGSLGDRLGPRLVLSAGTTLFAVGSAACGAAPSLILLIAARALQGVGAALLVPNSLAILRASIAEADQGRAIGIWAGLSGFTTALGPLVGGWLLGFASWRFIFYLNLPVAALALGATRRFVPPRSSGERDKVDLPGALLVTPALSAWVFSLIEGPAHGWSWPVLLCAGLGSVLFVAFLRAEATAPNPLLPMHLFHSLRFTGMNLTTLAVYFALSASLFFLTLELQGVHGYSPLAAGAAFTPVTILMLTLSPLTSGLTRRIGFRLPMTVGPLVVAASMWWLGTLPDRAPYVQSLLPRTVLLGLGLAITVAPLTTAVLSAVEPEHAGIASGVNNAVARLAGLLGVALLPGVAGVATAQLGGQDFSRGYVRAMRICAALCALGAAVSFLTLRPRQRRTRRTRAEKWSIGGPM
jgi:EmrB/QacA subfamily drug resistance transporter